MSNEPGNLLSGRSVRKALRRAWDIASRQPFIVPFLLLLAAIAINVYFQPGLLNPLILTSNLRIFLPLIFLGAAQTVVIIGGGIDLSSGAIVTLVNTVIASQFLAEPTPTSTLAILGLGLLVGMLAGVLNGAGVAFLRLQPIVTTYATSFIFAGLALYILPRPGGNIPSTLTDLYRAEILGIPFVVWAIAGLIGAWALFRSSRLARFLYATGGDDQAAYTTGVPVLWIRFGSYVAAGLLAALASFALTFNQGTGDPRSGGVGMTLDSIVVVVLGGTALTGGQGGVVGSVIGVVILGVIRNIISFAPVNTWFETLVDALIILSALAIPGLIRALRGEEYS